MDVMQKFRYSFYSPFVKGDTGGFQEERMLCVYDLYAVTKLIPSNSPLEKGRMTFLLFEVETQRATVDNIHFISPFCKGGHRGILTRKNAAGYMYQVV